MRICSGSDPCAANGSMLDDFFEPAEGGRRIFYRRVNFFTGGEMAQIAFGRESRFASAMTATGKINSFDLSRQRSSALASLG